MTHSRTKLAFACAVTIALVAALVACQEPPLRMPASTPKRIAVKSTCGIEPNLEPTCGAWWGVAANPLQGESWPQALADYEYVIGRTVNIAHFYHRLGQLFPTRREIELANEPGNERLLLINFKPAVGHTWRAVAQGAVDDELDRLARHITANFYQPFFLTIHHEPENEVDNSPGSGYTAQDYRAMFRHVVAHMRARGVDNVVWVMNYMGLPHWGTQPWFEDLYPGDDVVDWIAYDPYIFGTGHYWGDTTSLVNRRFSTHPTWPGFYRWATEFAPDKPLMLAEWGVAEKPGSPGAKAQFFRRLGEEIRKWPRVKALVYWNSAANRTVGVTRVDSSSASLEAFRATGKLQYFNP
ncbi:MAG TPA: hypothetical protein VIL34_02085 [Actinopolymorphaceae bacterium]